MSGTATGTIGAIERRHSLSHEEFRERFESGVGRPVVVTDAVTNWPARRWSFDLFRQRYGRDSVIVTDTLGKPNVARKLPLAEYMDYVERPGESPLGLIPTPTPLYMNHYSPFVDHPELLDEFGDPYFVQNLYRQLEGDAARWYNQSFGWVFIGPAGTVTPLHVDLFGTHAWLAQIAGTKRCWLYPPSDTPYLHDGAVSPSTPDLDRFPLYARTHPIEVVLGPEEVLFIPAGWLHYVVSLEKSITLTYNFVDMSNFATHIQAVARDLPLWTRKLDTPAARQALGIRWLCKGWETACAP